MINSNINDTNQKEINCDETTCNKISSKESNSKEVEYKGINYKEISSKTAIYKLNKKFVPYQYDLNIYRGCIHSCKYCFAVYSHKYLKDKYDENQFNKDKYNTKEIEGEQFFNSIFVKKNIHEILERELKNKNYKKGVINIGGVTDSYQEAEEHYKIMPDILKLLIKYKNPAIICTKSDLILRDFELIDKLSKVTYLSIASTITTPNENKRLLIECGAKESRRRFNMLKEIKKTSAVVGIHIMPIIPFVTDNFNELEEIFNMADNIKTDYLLTCILNLRGETRNVFFRFLIKKFPNVYKDIYIIFNNKTAYKEYQKKLNEKLRLLFLKYKVRTNYSKLRRDYFKSLEEERMLF